MDRPIAFVLTCCFGGLAAADCNEVLLYDNGYPNGCNGIRSEVGGNAAADDYHGPAGDFDGLHWYTLDAPGNVWDGNVTISVYDDADGDCLPDETAAATIDVPVDGGVANRTLILSPGPFSFDRWRYDAVCLGLSIDPGMFISAQAAVDSFWETTRCGANGDTVEGCDGAYNIGDGWTDFLTNFGDTADLAFVVATCATESACACDFNDDFEVDVVDLLVVIGAWGTPGGDCTRDGVTDTDDLLAVLGEWGPCATVLSHDACDDALLIYEGSCAFSTEQATIDANDPPWSCGSGGGPDVWFCFQAEFDGVALASTCDDADFDTVIAAYATDQPGCDGELIELGCNDDGPGCTVGTSLLEFETEEGQHYKIRVGGFDGAVGSGSLTVVQGSDCPVPDSCNPTCEDAVAMEIGDCIVRDTTGTPIAVFVEGCGFAPTTGTLWQSVIGDGTTLTVTTCAPGTTFDTIVTVLCGGCNQQFCVGENDDDPVCFENFVGESTVTFCTEPGMEYLVAVYGADGTGEYELCITSDGIPCNADPLQCVFVCDDTSGILNDCCESRLSIGDGLASDVDTTGANTDGQPDASCQFDGQTYHDVWFNYTATCDGILTVSTCNIASYDTDLVVYDGCGECYDGFALLGCNDDGAGCDGFSSVVTVPVTAGNCYKIRVGGWNDGDQGVTDLVINCEPLCTLECPAGADQEEGPQACPIDGDDASLDPNGGCNSDPVSFGTIAYDVPLCGQASTYVDISGGQFRDTDWYVFSVAPGGHEVTLTCHAEFGASFGIVSDVDTCAAPAFVVTGNTPGNCDEQAVTAFLAEGNYAAFCATNVFDGAQCSTGLNDYWLRIEQGLGPCVFECPDGASDENGPQQCPVDGDDDAADPNGGCNSDPVAFGALAQGETICGQGSTYVELSGGQFRDTDWYLFVHAGGDATVTVSAEFTALFGIVSGVDGCAAPAFVVSGNTAGNCDEQSVTAAGLDAGNYAVFVAPSVFDGVPCSDGLNDYWVRLD